jgi:uncharacterized membrane protein
MIYLRQVLATKLNGAHQICPSINQHLRYPHFSLTRRDINRWLFNGSIKILLVVILKNRLFQKFEI